MLERTREDLLLRSRLREGYGAIIDIPGLAAAPDAVLAEVSVLQEKWDRLQEKARATEPPRSPGAPGHPAAAGGPRCRQPSAATPPAQQTQPPGRCRPHATDHLALRTISSRISHITTTRRNTQNPAPAATASTRNDTARLGAGCSSGGRCEVPLE